MKKTVKILALVLTLSALFALSSCGERHVCDRCGCEFYGDAYYTIENPDATYCPDCARNYWAPYNYENYKKK